MHRCEPEWQTAGNNESHINTVHYRHGNKCDMCYRKKVWNLYLQSLLYWHSPENAKSITEQLWTQQTSIIAPKSNFQRRTIFTVTMAPLLRAKTKTAWSVSATLNWCHWQFDVASPVLAECCCSSGEGNSAMQPHLISSPPAALASSGHPAPPGTVWTCSQLPGWQLLHRQQRLHSADTRMLLVNWTWTNVRDPRQPDLSYSHFIQLLKTLLSGRWDHRTVWSCSSAL